MRKKHGTVVLDASVVVKLVLDEPYSEQAHSLLRKLAHRPETRLCVPDLLYTECTNVFWKYTRKGAFSELRAQEFLQDIRDYAFDTIPVVESLPKALTLAVRFGISVYDACYLAAADSVGGLLITADNRLVSKTATGKNRVQALVDAEDTLFG